MTRPTLKQLLALSDEVVMAKAKVDKKRKELLCDADYLALYDKYKFASNEHSKAMKAYAKKPRKETV